MPVQSLTDIVESLSPQQQDAVRRFIDYLKIRETSNAASSYLQAADEFIDEHPELLRRLAQ